MNKYTTKLIAVSVGITLANTAFAHDGHGIAGLHWHATDAWGFVAVAGMIAAAIWLSKK